LSALSAFVTASSNVVLPVPLGPSMEQTTDGQPPGSTRHVGPPAHGFGDHPGQCRLIKWLG
jgi:hypothetical protein